MPELSAVISCYLEEETIAEFHRRLAAALAATGRSHEMIFVNDGSTDGTLAALEGILAADPRVAAVVDLFRNSGQASAVAAGLAEASGSVVLTLDSDLQLDPEELPELLREYDRGADVVSGHRAKRRDSILRTLPSRLANMIMRRVSKTRLRDFGCNFKLYDARLLHALEFGPRRPFNPVSVISQAGRCAEVAVSHHPRASGRSGWSLLRLWDYLMEHLLRFGARAFQLLALGAVLLGLLLALRVGLEAFTSISILPGVTNELLLYAVLITFLLLLGAISWLGEFTIRAFLTLQREPRYVVRRVLRRGEAGGRPLSEKTAEAGPAAVSGVS